MSQEKNTPFNAVKASEVIGVTVKNAQDEDLGDIIDIILDKHSGETRYVVLSFGGFLGMGDKYIALPWRSISYDEELDSFILEIEKSRLETAPSFDKDHWPEMSDRQWEESIYSHYNEVPPYWTKE